MSASSNDWIRGQSGSSATDQNFSSESASRSTDPAGSSRNGCRVSDGFSFRTRSSTSCATSSGEVARIISSSSEMLISGLTGGGVRKSAMYPLRGSSARGSERSSSRRWGRIRLTHGMWSEATLGLRRARIAAAVSHMGEIANRVLARSSEQNLYSII